ncbi:Obp56d [Drosophila busckii]|uniref:Obp56d n=1 Tax=Drosophila busckii TaxID=30019 RepID=A0A0M3QVP7_DROBS|nr:general odorant-binding protein 56d [Drosophila busckii]ALC42763.1 Obp56d [Drosophila busckii]
MKQILLVVACLALAAADLRRLPEEQRKVVQEHVMHCMQLEDVSMEQIQSLINGTNDGIDAKLKCYTNCFFEQCGFIVNGQLQPDVMLEKLTDALGIDNVADVVANCKNIKGTEKCELGYQLHQCLKKNSALI